MPPRIVPDLDRSDEQPVPIDSLPIPSAQRLSNDLKLSPLLSFLLAPVARVAQNFAWLLEQVLDGVTPTPEIKIQIKQTETFEHKGDYCTSCTRDLSVAQFSCRSGCKLCLTCWWGEGGIE